MVIKWISRVVRSLSFKLVSLNFHFQYSSLDSEDERNSREVNHPTIQIISERNRRRRRKTVVNAAQSKRRALAYTIQSSKSEHSKQSDLSSVFEPAQNLNKLQLHVPSRLKPANRDIYDPMSPTEGGFGTIHPVCPSTRSIEESESSLLNSTADSATKPVADYSPPSDSQQINPFLSYSLNELASLRLTENQREQYTVFSRGYHPGQPNSRLYVKNLALSVSEEELGKIFSLFRSGLVADFDSKQPIVGSSDRFSIQLLTQGRMKGQAFINLPCESTAGQALAATNGLMLHNRPMVVQYARSAKTRTDGQSLINTKS